LGQPRQLEFVHLGFKRRVKEAAGGMEGGRREREREGIYQEQCIPLVEQAHSWC
jgi:hypothetical protein